MQREFKGFILSDDSAKLQFDAVCSLLKASYWGSERSRETIERSIRNSLCFGAYSADGRQAAFARAVTDYATTFWLCDFIVDAPLRGQGLGSAFLEFILDNPSLQGLNGGLATKDAQAFYAKFGFASVDHLFMGRKRAPGG